MGSRPVIPVEARMGLMISSSPLGIPPSKMHYEFNV